MAPIHTHLTQIKKQKVLFISILVNIIVLCAVIGGVVKYREQLVSALIQKIVNSSNKLSSYHLETTFNFSSLHFSTDFVGDTAKWKQIFMRWSFANKEDMAHLIFNKDNMYLKLDSSQLRQYITDEFKGNGSYTESADFLHFKKTILQNTFVNGKTYLLFNKTILDGLNPSKEYEKEVLESGRLMNEQIVKSLRLRGIPTIQFVSPAFSLKIPLRFDYQKLNSILFPSVRAFMIKDQQLLNDIFDKTTIDVYVNMRGEIIKIVTSCPPLSKKQIAGVFDDKPNHPSNIFWQLNDRIVNTVMKIDKQYVITFEFSNINKPISITPPKNSVGFQEMMNGLTQQPKPAQIPTPTKKKFVANNSFNVKSTGKEVDYNFFMIHNMLYRYYSDHGVYPSSLDLLSNMYFKGMVPGNPKTAQGFYYMTFENNKGYMLCPTAESSREYCHKKYLLDEVN
ncbi:MAG: hypothetical protein WA061_04000 [Microgenomates group bacterium]